MNKDGYYAIADALQRAREEPSCMVVVFEGQGSAIFSAGADLTELPDPTLAAFKVFTAAVLAFPKILVAAVNGAAVGIACTLLAHCDVVVASEAATFSVPFARIAVVPEFASSFTFPSTLGHALASDMMLCGRVLRAEEAKSAGLVADVVPASQLHEAVGKRVGAMLALPFADETLPLFKRMLRAARDGPVSRAHADETVLLSERLEGGKPAEAALAFMVARAAQREKGKRDGEEGRGAGAGAMARPKL